MSEIGLGDKVLECRVWRPGVESLSGVKNGEGTVTLIVDEGERRYRVVWESGIYSWHKRMSW